jgi:hypothetical protein
MRLKRRAAASACLNPGPAGSAVLGLGAVVTLAFAGLGAHVPPAAAGALSPPATTVASVVPSAATPGSQVTFAVSCASDDAPTATFFGRASGLPEQAPMDAGAADGDFTITVVLPESMQPGVYHPEVSCSDGTSATAALTVTAFPVAAMVHTSHGTTSTSGLATAGLVLIGVGVAAGAIAIRRRTSSRGRAGS